MALPLLSRRAFLLASGAVVVGAACGSSGRASRVRAGSGKSSGSAASGTSAGLQALRVSSDVYATPSPQRFAFAFTDHGRFVAGAPATVAFAVRGAPARAPQAATYRADGLPANRGIYTVEGSFPSAGVWGAEIRYGTRPVKLYFDVLAHPQAPIAGQPALREASPTVTNPLGVDPLCTRTDANGNPAPCPLHQVSLDQVIGRGKPVAVMFATPARCETRFCGPVLEQLLTVAPRYGDRVTLVHVEIYKNATDPTLVPTVEAWGLQSEPWLFGINGSGTVTERLDGAFATSEVTGLLDRLVA